MRGTKRMFQFLRGDLTDDSRHLIACDVHGGADSGSPASFVGTGLGQRARG
jgi:hypothetical protein